MIKGLGNPNFVSQAAPNSTEPQPEASPQQVSQVPTAGISSFADSFEQANPPADYSIFEQQQSGQTAFFLPEQSPAESKVDASTIFQYVPPDPPTPGPQPPPVDGLGKDLENLAEKKILETYQKKTTKDYGPDPKRLTDSTKYGDQSLPENLSNLGGGGGSTVGELQGSWNLVEFGKLDERTEGELGSAYAKGSTKVLALDGQVYYNVGLDTDKKTITVGGGAKGSAEIIGAHYEVGYSTPDITIGNNSQVDVDAKVNADAYVGAKGNAGASFTLGGENKANLEAGGFAGGRASLSGDVGVGDAANANGYIAGWTGIGAKAGAEIGIKDGEFSMKAGFGLALGLGLEWDLGLKVDYGRVARLGLDGMREIGLDDEANWISDRGDDLLEFAGDAANWAGTAAEDTAKAAAQATEDAVKAAQKALADAMGWTIDAVEDPGSAADDIIDTGEDLIEGAGEVVEDVVDWVGDLW